MMMDLFFRIGDGLMFVFDFVERLIPIISIAGEG
jgi:hypothetical protein